MPVSCLGPQRYPESTLPRVPAPTRLLPFTLSHEVLRACQVSSPQAGRRLLSCRGAIKHRRSILSLANLGRTCGSRCTATKIPVTDQHEASAFTDVRAFGDSRQQRGSFGAAGLTCSAASCPKNQWITVPSRDLRNMVAPT